MTVVSLFDGIGCGRIALERAGFKINRYYASEIEPNAMRVATYNFPDIIEIGDIRNITYSNGILYTSRGKFDIGSVDLLIGGSPCTNFSSIGYANGMVTGDVEITSLEQYLALKTADTTFTGQSYLFWEFVRLLKEISPKYFLLENVVMAKKWESIITTNMHTFPIKINSSLVSAQNRPRLYWTNIPNVAAPKNKYISLDSILSSEADSKDVFYCLTVQRSFPRMLAKYGYIPERFNAYNATELKNRGCALSRGSMITSSCATLLFVKQREGMHTVTDGILDGKYRTKLENGRYNIRRLSLLECERLQTLPDNYTAVSGIPAQKRNEMIGNGWTVDVIAHIFSFIKNTEGTKWNQKFSA